MASNSRFASGSGSRGRGRASGGDSRGGSGANVVDLTNRYVQIRSHSCILMLTYKSSSGDSSPTPIARNTRHHSPLRSFENPFSYTAVHPNEDDEEEFPGLGSVPIGKFTARGHMYPNLVVARFEGDELGNPYCFHIEVTEVDKHYHYVRLPNYTDMQYGIVRSDPPSPSDREVKLDCIVFDRQFRESAPEVNDDNFRSWLMNAVENVLSNRLL